MHDIKKPLGYVYMTTNTLNGKYYIGSHVGSNPNYMGSGTALKLAFAKYGLDSFAKEVLYYCDDFQQHEEALLVAIDAAEDPQMYNLINSGTGGCLGLKHSSESLAKMSASQLGKTRTAEACVKMSVAKSGHLNPYYGMTHTEETRAKMSASHLGKTVTAETRAKLSAAHLGKTHTEETRAKIGAAHLGKTVTEETRAKIGAAQRKPQTKGTCPHCLKTGGVSNMTRYHFDNCKQAPK